MALDRTVGLKVRVEGEGDEELIQKQADALSYMEEAGEKAGEALDAAGDAAARGLGSAKNAIDRARVALDDYRASLAIVASTGGVVSDEQLAKLAQLEQEYNNAVGSLGEFRAAQQQVKRDVNDATEAAGGQAERINSLGDIMRKIAEDLGPGATKWLSWGAAAAGALKVGYEGGEKLRAALNWMGDGQFDRNLQSLSTWFINLGKSEEEARQEAELLRNQINILRNEGIDPTGMSAEQVAAQVEQLGRAMQETAIQAGNAVGGFTELRKELDSTKDRILAQIELMERATKDLSGEKQAEIIRRVLGDTIREHMDLYEQFGQTVDQELQKAADGYEILSSKAEESADRNREAIRQILSDIKGEMVRTRDELERDAEALARVIPDAFASMPPINFLSPEQFENAQVVIRQMINTFKAAGETIPVELEQWAIAAGVFNDAVAGINLQPLIDAGNRAGEILRQLQGEAMAAADSVQRVFRDPLAVGDTQTEQLDPGDGVWVWE